MPSTLSERLERTCKAFPTRPAFFENRGAPVTFGRFLHLLLGFAERLTQAGVGPGDNVVVGTRDMISVTTLKLALVRIGATPIAVGPKLVEEGGKVRVDRAIVPASLCTGHPRELSFDRSWLGSPQSYVPVTPGGSIIHATSGTTGVPKLRRDTEGVFLQRIINGLNARGALDGPVFVAQNVGSLIGIKSIVSALLEVQPVMAMQTTPEETVRGLRANEIEHAFVPPLHLKGLVDAAEAEGIETPRLKRINVGGGTITGRFAGRCEHVFGCEVYTDYGSTETDTIASYRVSQSAQSPGLVGPIWEGFGYRFETPAGQAAPSGEGGELVLRVPETMRTENYPQGPALFDADGWIATGDIGRLDADGRLILSGRKSELINVGGNKLAPGMLEHQVATFDGVADVAAFRVATETGIDAVGLAVVPAAGFDAAGFERFLADTVSPLYDFRVVTVDAIPLTPSGKIDRGGLTARESQEGGGPAPT